MPISQERQAGADKGSPTRDFAKLLYEALRENDPEAFMDSFECEDRVTIDGEFQLFDVAKTILASHPGHSERRP